jgi:phospholipid/cholesterol/gamma-HCH transport system substrate-binding protein
MMKLKFNKFERVAGLFVLFAFFGFVLFAISVAVKQGWFESKVHFISKFKNADGIHIGTLVQISGLRAGAVTSVELLESHEIKVKFYVHEKFHAKVKKDSKAQLIRPFIIGDRVLEVTRGSVESEMLPANATVANEETMDLMTLLSGRDLGVHMKAFSGLMDNFKFLAEAFLNKDRTESMVRAFDRIDPLIKNMNTMSIEVVKMAKQANQDENFGHVLMEFRQTAKDLNEIIPRLAERAPELTQDLNQLVGNLAILTEDFKVVLPALAEVAPELPFASRRAVEALDEAVVLIKAMQKNFFVRGSAEEVREEEAKSPKQRRPASK